MLVACSVYAADASCEAIERQIKAASERGMMEIQYISQGKGSNYEKGKWM